MVSTDLDKLQPKNIPFIRWAGSKRKIIPTLASYWDDTYERYVEPFMGSASLFLALSPPTAVLNDLNCHLVSAIATMLRRPKEVYRTYISIPIHKQTYYDVRQKITQITDPVLFAAHFLYLNRNCFNGLYRTNKMGIFNVPFSGRKSGSVVEWDTFFSSILALRCADLQCGDFEEFAERNVRKGDFVYLDPPYAVRNRRIFTQYGADTFGLKDLQRLTSVLSTINRRKATFLLSYADCSDARQLFARWNVRRVRVVRNISGFSRSRRSAYELIVTN